MSNFNIFAPVYGGAPNESPSLFQASTDDALSVVIATGYLNDKAGTDSGEIVKNGDIFMLTYDVDGTPGYTMGYASVSGDNTNFIVGLPGLTQALEYQGTWNASTNTPTLVNPPAASTQGQFYIVSVAGTQFSLTFAVGDWIVSNGAAWTKVDNSEADMPLASAHIFVGNGSGVATDVAMTGDITITNAGVTAIGTDVIVNADVSGTAAIAWTKLATGTVSKAVVTNGGGFLDVSATSATEIGYVTGVTSAIQTQLNAKQSTALADGSILIGNGSGVATANAVTGDVTITNAGVTAIGAGVIVNADVNGSAAIALTKLAAATASKALVSDASGFITASATSDTEIGYVAGVTSAIQTQLNAKAPLASPTFTGNTSITGTLSVTNAGTFAINGATPVVVSDAAVTAASIILLTRQVIGGTPLVFDITSRSAGVSFTVTGTATDSSTVGYVIIEPL